MNITAFVAVLFLLQTFAIQFSFKKKGVYLCRAYCHFYIECVYRGNGGDDGSWYYEFNEP